MGKAEVKRFEMVVIVRGVLGWLGLCIERGDFCGVRVVGEVYG